MRTLLKIVVVLMVLAGVGTALWIWAALRFSYSDGERAGYIATLGQLRSFGIPVLGSVTFLVTEALRRRNLRHAAVICASTVVMVLTYGVLLVSTTGFNLLFGIS